MTSPCDRLDPYDAIHKKTLDKYIPFKVDWEITYRCNLNCHGKNMSSCQYRGKYDGGPGGGGWC